ncbi:MFS transporter-like protein [Massariosphaeria phaeospora]|uniref:MFS transporter-like protein n=1 Tax=Massariosphaeria phaeospora TaxID=100035 RepID=A0A7C8M2X2_9PLEO|nr:MFS transporter-like protein [Massariosphaeria phaeospora]
MSDESSPLLVRSASAGSSPASNDVSTSLTFRVAAAMFSFTVLGLFTSSIGVMLQPISQYYNLSDLRVSLIFLVGPVGYVFGAQSNAFIHSKLGQRGIACLGPVFHILSALTIAIRLPYYVVLVAFATVALGTGLLDGSWCAWAGSMANANTVSGLLHGSFSVGAAVGPFVAGTLMEQHRPWYEWYYVLFGASVLELLVLACAFRHDNASKYRNDKPSIEMISSEVNSKAILRYRATWMSAAYFLAYVGTETAISGWIVSFMVQSRHATLYIASLTSSCFWAGMAVGRLTLGAMTDKIGVGSATTIYILSSIALELLFVAVREPVVSTIIISLLGFSMGPLFPSGIVVLTQLLPKDMHVAAVSFVASVGQVGGAILPFAIGAIVDGVGIRVFQYAIVLFSVVVLVLWIFVSRLLPASADESAADGGPSDT